jgi:CPA1 family monovalent cation:H+ antiporter
VDSRWLLYGYRVTAFELTSVVVCLAAAFGLASHRFLRLPSTIGTMVLSLVSALLLTVVGKTVPSLHGFAAHLFERIDFHDLVLHCLLAFLLFAGALHLDLDELKEHRVTVFVLSTVGTLASAALVAGLLWLILRAVHLPVSAMSCLIFGALISPTDPIAVLEMLRRVGAPLQIQTLLGGESLFNDGVGAVLFLALLATPASRALPSIGSFTSLFLLEAGGGTVLGLALGWIVYRLLRLVDSYKIEVFLTLALAMGGYALADALHVSAPLEAVMAGLVVNGQSRFHTMSPVTRDNLDKFWGLLDDMLNVILFFLLGFALIVVQLSGRIVAAGLLAIPAVLLARAVTVWLLLYPRRTSVQEWYKTGLVMTWGGLRGALSVALVLALAATSTSSPLLAITYIVVVFSVLVQGLTMVPLLRWLGLGAPQRPRAEPV